VTVVPASSLSEERLRALFNHGFSDYLVPMHLGQDAFAEHLAINDVDLACSRVAGAPEPAAVALLARRGRAGWVAGMGTAPTHRRRGLGERALSAATAAAAEQGTEAVWLEVIDRNLAAVALYEKLGFATVRDLTVWSRPPTDDVGPPCRHVPTARARAWIAEHRTSREPWQRADESVVKLEEQLTGLVVESDGEPAAAMLYRDAAEQVTVLQLAARDADAAAAALRAATGLGRVLRMANVADDDPASAALEGIGARPVVRQHEMRLALSP
jgi:GNAT superfamily N-acetyltransferase